MRDFMKKLYLFEAGSTVNELSVTGYWYMRVLLSPLYSNRYSCVVEPTRTETNKNLENKVKDI